MKQRRAALALCAAGALAAAGVAVVTLPAAAASAGCSVTYQNLSTWQSTPTSGGFTTSLAITNLGDPISHWTLTFTLPSGQTRSGGWNASFTGTTAVTATDAGWNGAIGTGTTNTSVGLQGDWTRSASGSTPPAPFPQPSNFALNGVACTGSTTGPGPSSPGPSSPKPSSPGPSASTSTPPAKAAPALHVSGNKLVTAAGTPYRLLGVNRSSGEFACIQGNGMWDGPADQASINAMKTWNVHVVRIPLNEECWLGTDSVPANGTKGAAYQQAVKDYVNLLVASGITPIVEMHWNYGQYSGAGAGCSDVKATCQKPMPDAQYAPTFWTQLATAFKGNNAVVFDLFNEPYPDAANNWTDATAAWTCLRDGGTCTGIGYPVAGMQSLVNAVRGTGATNVIMTAGLTWTNDMTQWLQYKPSDPLNNLAASWHTYNFNACVTASCWDSQIAPVAAQVPLVATEIGQNTCAHDYIDQVMAWADTKGIGYLAWTWNPWGVCGSAGNVLITDWNGTPTATFGEGYKAHLLTQNP
ncbi:cellulase family glycosylhydrolase [Dactylosporangium sp. NPDC051541]|uniref:cellulase family glycosylhydrolase n=1 Tax=Dactylosporangium sp. NPDC051541 TaxID=3363977 RepID=UPI0037A8F3B6